jgi:predicted nuclease of restriction endonuclease-like (RecB) superfamily
LIPADYGITLKSIQERVRQERSRAILAVNSSLILLYWDIGRLIVDRQAREGWGTKIIERLGRDLRMSFPEMHGFSTRNLQLMRRFAEEFSDSAIVQQLVALWDPYVFDFLAATDLSRERQVEQALVDHIQRFMLELGSGFAFVGRQVHVVVGDVDYFLDLLFYHLKLRCFVVVELKAVSFDPAFVGQINLYLSAVDDQLRHATDQPTIGLLLCRSKHQVVVEYALRGMTNPIGVAAWETTLARILPESLARNLPSVEEIEAELGGRDS